MEELSGLDARFLYSETPSAHMHTLKIAVVDLSGRSSDLDPSLFVELMGQRLDRLWALRRRAVPVPLGIGHPVWIDDPDFDLARHVTWRTAAPPGGDRELSAVVSEIAAVPLRRDRPLWELTVVDGLAGGRTAFVVKLHHAVADGVAAVSMLENAFVPTERAVDARPHRPEPLPTRRQLLGVAAAGSRRRLGEWVPLARSTGTGLVAAARARRAAEVRLPVPFGAPRTPYNAALVPARSFATLSLPLPDLLAARRSLGVTLNDVFLAVCGGALRRNLQRVGALPPATLVAAVPVATGLGGGHLAGNHVDNMMVPLGTDVRDPSARAVALHRAVLAARDVRAALGPELFERRASLTPPHLTGWSMRLLARSRVADVARPPVNVVVSNVPGPRAPLELDGGLVTDLLSVGPVLEGVGLNLTAWSYVDRLAISVLASPNCLPEPWALVDDLRASAAELVAAAAGEV